MRQLQLNLGKNFIYVPSDKEVEANQVSIRSSVLDIVKKEIWILISILHLDII